MHMFVLLHPIVKLRRREYQKKEWQKQSDKPHFGCVAGPDQRKLTVFDRIVMVSEGDQ